VGALLAAAILVGVVIGLRTPKDSAEKPAAVSVLAANIASVPVSPAEVPSAKPVSGPFPPVAAADVPMAAIPPTVPRAPTLQPVPVPVYGLAHIRNESVTIATTYYRWGKGPWKMLVIERGKTATFAHVCEGPDKSTPDLYIRFDTNTAKGSIYPECVISRSLSPNENSTEHGHTFAIKQIKGTTIRQIETVTNGAVVKVINANSSKPQVK
jgi:hypothetical protein